MGNQSGRTIAPQRLALADQILMVLRDADLPMRPGQIADVLGPQSYQRNCRCACGHTHQREGTRMLWNSDLNPLLHRMEREGAVVRYVVPRGSLNPTGAHYWGPATTNTSGSDHG